MCDWVNETCNTKLHYGTTWVPVQLQFKIIPAYQVQPKVLVYNKAALTEYQDQDSTHVRMYQRKLLKKCTAASLYWFWYEQSQAAKRSSAGRGRCYWRMPTAEYLMSCKGWREDFESPAKRSPVVSESHRNTDGQELWLRSGSSLLVCCCIWYGPFRACDRSNLLLLSQVEICSGVSCCCSFIFWKVQQKRMRNAAGFKSKQRLNSTTFLMCSITVAFLCKW